MARSFAPASSQFASVSAAPVTAYPFTLTCWFNSNSAISINTLVNINNNGTSQECKIDLGSTQLRAGVNGNFATATAPSFNIWNHAAGVFTNATLRQVYANGVAGTQNTTSVTPSGLTTTTIGERVGGTNFMNGELAEIGIWNVALTVGEIQALAAGILPYMIRPGALVAYWPLWGLASPEPDVSANVNNLTLTNSPVYATHAPVTLFSPKARTPPDIVTPAAATPFGWEAAYPHFAGGKIVPVPY